MGLLMRGLCAIAGHCYRTIKKDNVILVRECLHCGKIEKITLVK